MGAEKQAIWQSIATALTSDLSAGKYREGDKLPTEAELAARFAVNRHTVRRALSSMADNGLVHARRGAGVFVTHRPTDYPIGKRVRFHQNLRKAGRLPSRKLHVLETRRSTKQEAEALALTPGDPVHICDGVSMADATVIGLFHSVFPAARLPELPDHLRAFSSVTKALNACGVADYTRASSRIEARAATAEQARHLRINTGAPVLRVTSLNVGLDGDAVEFGRTWFSGAHVTLTMEDDDPVSF